MNAAFTTLRLAVVAVCFLDALIGLPGTQGAPGVAPRMFLAPLVLIAVFLVTQETLRDLWSLLVLIGAGLLTLVMRDVFLPARLGVIPADLELVAAVISTALWFFTIMAAARWTIDRRYADRLAARMRDEKSGLYNAKFFETQLGQLLSPTNRRREPGIALLNIDLDNFKQINDQLGHAEGDRAIADFGAFLGRLQPRLLRAEDYACRVGGDEFAVILRGIEDERVLSSIADRIAEEFERWLVQQRPQFVGVGLGMSVGYAMAARGMTTEDLKELADRRMYENKTRNKAARASYDRRSLESRGGRGSL